MPLISSDARFLGVDLALLWRDMREPWRNVHQWPLLAWLTPQPPVLLRQADGRQSVWVGGKQIDSRTVPQFTAVELPDDYVLRRPLSMPAMAHDDALAAMALEARSSSPFDAADMVWGYTPHGKLTAAGQSVELVIASRKQIAQYLAGLPADVGTSTPEVWVLSGTAAPAVLCGYGEPARETFCSHRRRVGLVLVACLALGCGVLAVTPSIQLRARAIQAATAYEDIAKKSAPAVRQREQLLSTVEAVSALAELTNGRIEPLLVLDKLTQVLPDDTALQHFKLQGNKLSFSGQTGNPSALMQLLGEVPGFKEVHAPTAATRLGLSGKEVFSVELILEAEVFGVKTVPLAPPEGLSAGPAASAPADGVPATAAISPTGGASSTAVSPFPPASAALGGASPASAPRGSGGATFGGGAAFGGAPAAPAVPSSAASPASLGPGGVAQPASPPAPAANPGAATFGGTNPKMSAAPARKGAQP